MELHYTNERNTQILISLLKQYGIKKIIASPGATNVSFVGSVMHDSYFEIYSCVDERSAAYMACGMAEESGEPVVLSCTGATASRNYLPGLTEAYYRKLPIIAVTSTQNHARIGNLVAQVIDRSTIQHDIAIYNFLAESVKDKESERSCVVKMNKALHIATVKSGPVHINLETTYSNDFSVEKLPDVAKINFYTKESKLPSIPKGKIGVFIGSHKPFIKEETDAIDAFCATHDAIVFCDHTSGYHGKYRFMAALLATQTFCDYEMLRLNLAIHLGEVSGDYATLTLIGKAHTIWRVNKDGEPRDSFGKLSAVFKMDEQDFFSYYNDNKSESLKNGFLNTCQQEYQKIYQAIPDELPFSNIWIAYKTAPMIPQNSNLHLGILNSLRSWNLFDVHPNVKTNCNVGGFGIDGCLSSLIGASLASPDRLFYGIFGDLAFFYDMNALGNHHIGNNVRIMVINNGRGQEFRNYNHRAAMFREETDPYIAAAGHFGNQSPALLKHYAEDLGFKYLTASDKQEFENSLPTFINSQIDNPLIFEVFTSTEKENEALTIINHIKQLEGKAKLKEDFKSLLGDNGINVVNKIFKRK